MKNLKDKFKSNPSIFLHDFVRFKSIASAMEKVLSEHVIETEEEVLFGSTRAYVVNKKKKVIVKDKADRYIKKQKLEGGYTYEYTPASLSRAFGKDKAKEILADLEKFDAIREIEYSIFKIKP